MSLEFVNIDYSLELYDKNKKGESSSSKIYSEGTVQLNPETDELELFQTDGKNDLKFPLHIQISEIIFNEDLIKAHEKIIKINQLVDQGIYSVTIIYKFDDLIYQIKIQPTSMDKESKISFIKIRQLIDKELDRRSKNKNKEYQDIIKKKPTSYQLELLEEAKKKNLIVFLETGKGKTYIAILLLKEIFGEPIEANKSNQIKYEKKDKKISIFLFNTISLLIQQSKVIKHNTNLKVRNIYGNNERSRNYKHYAFRESLKNCDVICATPEALYRYFTFGYLFKSDINLIVLDECHHCKENHFYNRIMQHFILNKDNNNQDNNQYNPKILGLTASPTDDAKMNKERIEAKIKDLCNNMNCYISCPKNILQQSEENKNIPTEFLDTNDNNEELEIKNKNLIFQRIIVPFLEYHLRPKFDSMTKIYNKIGLLKPKKKKKGNEEKEKKEDEEEEEEDEGEEEDDEDMQDDEDYDDEEAIKRKEEKKKLKEEKLAKKKMNEILEKQQEEAKEEKEKQRLNEENLKIEQKNKTNLELKEQIRIQFAIYILNHYLTLFTKDELKAEEKFMGLYDKDTDINLLKRYEEYLKNNKNVKKGYFVNQSLIDEFIKKLENPSTLANSADKNLINYSLETKKFNKSIGEDDEILKLFRTYTKIVNLCIKYLDTESLYNISTTKFLNNELITLLKSTHSKDLNDTTADESYIKKLNEKIKPLEELLKKDYKFKSTYLDSLIKFILSKKEEESKSVLFINNRLLCETFYKRISEILNLHNTSNNKNYKCYFVVGTSSSDNYVKYNESDLKKNLDEFRKDNDGIISKILIATNVVEEGMDVPACNNIICLSKIQSIKEYIQKTGRGRKENSKLLLFSKTDDKQKYLDYIENIKLAIEAMKEMVQNKGFKPDYKPEVYINGYNCYITKLGARAYYNYAPKIVNDFIFKLYNDGYTYNRIKFCVSVKDKKYTPFLVLPEVLECKFQKIYDDEDLKFDKEEDALKYCQVNEEFYYLKALMYLHRAGYLNDFLQFNKGYDKLFSQETKSIRFKGENSIELKIPDQGIKSEESEYVECYAHILNLSPGYLDLTYNEESRRNLVLLTQTKFSLSNFDIFIYSKLLLKLYHFNYRDGSLSEEEKKWYKKKPKIPYKAFSKLNVNLEEVIKLKIPKDKMDLINFFYIYTLFLSCDAELFFYYGIFNKKFEFCRSLFTDKDILDDLKNIFKLYDKEYLNEQKSHHLNNYRISKLNYENHFVKFSFATYDKCRNEYDLDFNYIKTTYETVVKEIKNYNSFITKFLKTSNEVENLLRTPESLQEESDKLEDELRSNSGENPREIDVGEIGRNLITFNKCIVMCYGSKTIKGDSKYVRHKGKFRKLGLPKSAFTYQTYYLYKYGLLTTNRSYQKCLYIDHNSKMFKYKINMSSLGDVKKIYSNRVTIKHFHFLPKEVLSPMQFITIDQLYTFTLFPIILSKLQNSLIYYYNTRCLKNLFPLSIGSINKIDLKLMMQCLNSRTTLEPDNYERLEFLGDAILKFLSSVELFNKYPEANRDLLFSLRREIENNQILSEKTIEKNLAEFLFTSPITIKKMKIPGFSMDDSLIFNIGYNRSFSRFCFESIKNNIKLDELDDEINSKDEIKDESKYKIQKEIEEGEVNLDKMNEKDKEKYLEIEQELAGDEQKYLDKYRMVVEYIEDDNNNNNSNNNNSNNNNNANNDIQQQIMDKKIFVDDNEINDVVNNKIKIIPAPNDKYRTLYQKSLADMIESLTGFVYCSKYDENKQNYDESFNLASFYLKEMNVLKITFSENLEKITKIALEDLNNPSCKFSEASKDKYLEVALKNYLYKFKNKELCYQAMTHPSLLSYENQEKKLNYVKKSYQRLSFLGEALVELYVTLFVFNDNLYESECTLHKMRICGINHHIISFIAANELKLNDCLLKPSGGGINTDIKTYINKLKTIMLSQENIYKIPKEEFDDDEFVIILCELFHSYIGAIFVDSGSVAKPFEVLDKLLKEHYLPNNATRTTFTEHPKEVILQLYNQRRSFFKKISENGANRIILKFVKGQDKEQPYRKQKNYTYQLIIDDFIIYEENIKYSRVSIKAAQQKALIVFQNICDEMDRRIKYKLNPTLINTKSILEYLKINYVEQQQ